MRPCSATATTAANSAFGMIIRVSEILKRRQVAALQSASREYPCIRVIRSSLLSPNPRHDVTMQRFNESREAKPHSWPFSPRDEWRRRDASDIDGLSREAEWSFWEKRYRRQSREGSGERAGTRTSFKGAGASKSIRPRAGVVTEEMGLKA